MAAFQGGTKGNGGKMERKRDKGRGEMKLSLLTTHERE
jgi:hypothetical protein